MDDVLKQIKDAEQKARAVVDAATQKKESILRSAREEAHALEENEIAMHREEIQRRIEKERDAMRKEGAVIVDEGRKNAARVRKKAEAGAAAAQELLLRKFNELVE